MKHIQSLDREELHRAFCGTGMKLAVLTGLVIAFVHMVLVQLPLAQENRMGQLGLLVYPLEEPYYASFYNLMMDILNPEGYTFYLLIPLIAVMPFSASFYFDHRGGYDIQLCQRVSRRQYLRSKYLACFLSGGTAISVPLLFSYISALMILPDILPAAAMGTNVLTPQIWLSDLYFSKPAAYLLIYMALDFLMGGFYACFGLVLSLFVQNCFVVWSAGFLLQLLVHTLVGSANMTMYYSALNWMRPGVGIVYPGIVLLWILLLGIVPGVLYHAKAGKKDFI